MKIIGWDTETYKFAPGVAAPKLVCMSHDDGVSRDVVLRDVAMDTLFVWLADPTIVLVGHHIPFDLGVAAAEACERGRGIEFLKLIFRAIKERRLRDTKLREQILENAKGELKYDWDEDLEQYRKSIFTLERVAYNRLRDEDGRPVFVSKKADTWRLRYGLLDGIPVSGWPEDAVKYALKDAELPRRIFLEQERVALEEECPVHEDGLADIPGEVATTLAAFVLGLMRIWGVRTDPEATKIVRAEFQEKFDAAIVLARKWRLVSDLVRYQVSFDNHKPRFITIRRDADVNEESLDLLKRVNAKRKKKGPAAITDVKLVGEIEPSRKMKEIRDRVQYLYAKNGEDVPLSDSGKNIATDRETLTFKRFPAWEKDEGLMAVADVVRYEKLLTTYVPILEKGMRVPITPNWNAMVETFRTSCADPNLQNMPRGSAKHGDDMVRRCFVPREGHVFVECDYSTLEMRTLAQTCITLFGYSTIAEAFREDKDTHLLMTANTLEMSYEEAERRYKQNDQEIENARQYSKIASYGFMGLMGPDAFVDYARGYDIVVPRDKAARLRQDFMSTFSEMRDYFAYCSALCDGEEATIVVHPLTGYARGRVRYTALANNGFQHPAAVGAKAALCAVVEECYADVSSVLFGCRPVVFSHDSIMMEVPRANIGAEKSSAAADRLSQIMIEKMEVICPDVPIKTDYAMMRRWTKGAKPVRVDGILVPSKKAGKDWVADLPEENRAAA